MNSMKRTKVLSLGENVKQTFFMLGCFLFLICGSSMYAQNNVRGTVKDSKGDGLIGVNVIVKGTSQGTVTDENGGFNISVADKNAVLEFSYVGFKTMDVSLQGETILNILMTENTDLLDEVVVVGYGTQKKVNLTGSVNNVKGSDLIKRNASNTSIALQGMMPGVSVSTSSGRPGFDGAGIQIRGTGSLNSSSNPLVLIDGVIVDMYAMNFIDMNIIESISVLKDAASASIYGSRASNGVILITTKRAKENKIKVAYDGYVGFNSPTNIPAPVSGLEYMEAINIARANVDMAPQYSEEIINKYKTSGPDNVTLFDTNWRKEIIKENALQHNNSISVSGGSNDIRFFANAAYFYQDGNIANNIYDRMSLKINTDANITKWMKLGLDLNVRQSKSVQPAFDFPEGIINKATTFVPVFSGRNNDGTYGYGQNGDNPIASAEVSGLSTSRSPEYMIKGSLVMHPLKGLELATSYSSRRVEGIWDYFIKPYDTYEGGIYKTTFPVTGRQKGEGWDQSITKQFNLQGSYEKQILSSLFNVLLGVQTEEMNNRSFSASRKGYPFDGFEDLDHGDLSTSVANGNHLDWAMLSYYMRFNYNFRERYLLELNGRWDASSRFLKNYRWGFFPSISAGWRISEEAFFEPLRTTVNNLKLRLSYGTLGNQDIYSYFPYAATISPGYGYWFDEVLGSGSTQTQVANEKITWEKSTQKNIGIDAGLFNSKLALSFDYYIKNINDMLQQFPIPLYVGLSAPWENAGSMRNNGWDLTATWRDKVKDFSYSITGNLSDVKNTITNLYGKEYVGTQITREGDPIYSWYGYLSDGYFQTMEEIEKSPVYGDKKNIKPGYIKYKDTSGPENKPDGVINDYDRVIIGDPAPRYEYSVNLGAEWRNFDLSLLIQGVGKRDIFYSGYGARPFYVGRSMFKNQLDYWTPENRNAKFPLLLIEGSEGTNPNNIISDFWVKSGAYMRLKNVVIGYTIPKAVSEKMYLTRVRFYVSAQNLLTLTNAYEGYDPENSVSDGYFYPLMRTITFGLNINF